MVSCELKNESAPVVSVVVAAYNAGGYIGLCLDSLLAQDYDNIEIVVCDDCSTDDTRTVVNSYSKLYKQVKLLVNEENMGQAYSRNRCIEECSGEYILIQDADDLSAPERISTLLGVICSNESVDFVGSDFSLFDSFGEYKKCHLPVRAPEKKDFLAGMPFCHASILFKAGALDLVSGYRVNSRTRRSEDYDMLMRMYSMGLKGVNHPEVLYMYRVDKNTYSRRTFKYRLDECVVRFFGYKELGILFPCGWLFALKPILAHAVQLIRVLGRSHG